LAAKLAGSWATPYAELSARGKESLFVIRRAE
jgi:hypothetical protein